MAWHPTQSKEFACDNLSYIFNGPAENKFKHKNGNEYLEMNGLSLSNNI